MFVLITQECIGLLLTTGIIAAAAGFFICHRLNNTDPTDPTGPTGPNDLNIDNKLLTNEEALQMINRYREQVSIPVKDNTASGYIDIDVLNVYIDTVRAKCAEVGKELTGLEYYFAKYEGEINEGDNSGRSTIIFFPTYWGEDEDGNTGNIPFDPFQVVNPVHVRNMNTAWRSAQAPSGGQTSRSAQGSTEFSGSCALNKSNMSPPKKPITI